MLWILYLAFAYLVYAIVLLLVVGYKNLGPWEWTGMAGGPVVIYLVRALTNAYFNFRIESLESRLKEQQDDRSKTIQKLKEATRYDSTLQLLEKYGGEKHRRSLSPDDADPDAQKKAAPQGNPAERPTTPQIRTTHAPPPTANIQGPPSRAGTPHSQLGQAPPFMPPAQPPSRGQTPLSSHPDHVSNAEFAPNASGDMPPAYHQYDYSRGPPQWYDRILDLMLGEDETAPRNRIVLICPSCRLVNGQAPPGTRTLADVGKWKCMGCGAMNGELDEGKKIMNEVLGKQGRASRRDNVAADERDSETHGAFEEGDDFGDHSSSSAKKRGSK